MSTEVDIKTESIDAVVDSQKVEENNSTDNSKKEKEYKPYFVLSMRLEADYKQKQILEKRFGLANRIHNIGVKHAQNELQRLYESKEYKDALNEYNEAKKAKNDEAKKVIKQKLNDIVKKYCLNKAAMEKYLAHQQHMHKKNLDSFTVQKIAADVAKGIGSVIYGKGKKVHFRKNKNCITLEGKNNNTGITLKYDDGGYYLNWLGLKVYCRVRRSDIYLKTALEEREIAYCRIERRPFNSGYRYFLQVVFKGYPPVKTKKKKYVKGRNRVGVDIGTSTIAITNGKKCVLKELAEGIEKYENEIEILSERLERQQRLNNPQNYKEDGTIKKSKKTWIYTKNYYRTLWKLRNLYRKRAIYLRQSHNILAKEIISMGNDIYVETMNFSALAKKAKETKVNEKTGKYKSKKRFGKSVETRAPAMFLEILNTKLSYQRKQLHKVNTKSFKASQYNHITDTCTKKELDDRGNIINGEWVQRDLYSAFLLMNSNDTLEHTDRNKCLSTYPTFKKAHDTCINKIVKSGKHTPSSFGIQDFIKFKANFKQSA